MPNPKKRVKLNETNFVVKEKFQQYGKVLELLGDGRLKAVCEDNQVRICTIRGKLKNKVWIRKDDIILVSLRDFDEKKGDVIHKYDEKQIKQLLSLRELDKEKLEMFSNTN